MKATVDSWTRANSIRISPLSLSPPGTGTVPSGPGSSAPFAMFFRTARDSADLKRRPVRGYKARGLKTNIRDAVKLKAKPAMEPTESARTGALMNQPPDRIKTL